jgi:hypothetical protein
LRAFGGVLAIAIGAGIAGAALGFLFGIPRYEPRETTPAGGEPPAGAQQAGAQQAGAQQQAGRQQQSPAAPRRAAARLQLNTNLIKISDWLTNGIVVLSLVEAKTFGSGFLSVTQWAANWLFDGRHGSPVLLGTAIFGSGVIGLLYGTVYTQLVITRLLAAVDDALRLPSGLPPIPAHRLLQAEALAPQFSRFSHPTEPPTPFTAEELGIAFEYNDIAFEDLVSDPYIGFDDILSWSRAKALLNDYRAAARGYLYLLSMSR